jgi:hypothetical protein
MADLFDDRLKDLEPPIQSDPEPFFFSVDDALEMFLARLDFGENVAH